MARTIRSEKYFFMKFDTGKWLKDPNLSMCRPETRGIWIDLICAMHESSRSGKITGTLQQLTQVARCTTAEMSRAIEDLKATKTANVTVHNENVTLVNRGMAREAKKRESTRLRVKRHREKEDVTQMSQGEVRSYILDTPIVPLQKGGQNGGNGNGLPVKSLWLILWENYPSNRRGDPEDYGEESAFHEFMNLKPDKALLDRMLAALEVLKQSEDWTKKNGQYVKGFAKWLRSREWEHVQVEVKCSTCNRIGIIVRSNGDLIPWTIERECEQGLKPEVCPHCKGKNRISAPGLPNIKFPEG